MEDSRVAAGKFFFKYRSFLPLPLIVLIALFFRPACSAALTLGIVGLFVALAGQIIRCLAVGFAAVGTSGRESFLRAEQLNSTGLYSLVRNPLYIGNLIIYAGLLLSYGNILSFFLGLACLAGEYVFIVAAEEHYLKEKYGALYLNYCQRVPRWLPRPRLYMRPGGRFQWPRVVFKENDSLFNLLAIYIFIIIFKEMRLRGHIRYGTAIIVAASLLLTAYATVKIIKKRKGA